MRGFTSLAASSREGSFYSFQIFGIFFSVLIFGDHGDGWLDFVMWARLGGRPLLCLLYRSKVQLL
uniref:Uncharacterized protein n=1 Tax=Rhizophora mucronata TaxID=61149 RepID=A0A2P2QLZ1_RHIMU